MKKRFGEAQIIGFLRGAEAGLSVKQLCRRHGFSEASYYLWRNKFGGMTVSDAKRLKELIVGLSASVGAGAIAVIMSRGMITGCLTLTTRLNNSTVSSRRRGTERSSRRIRAGAKQ